MLFFVDPPSVSFNKFPPTLTLHHPYLRYPILHSSPFFTGSAEYSRIISALIIGSSPMNSLITITSNPSSAAHVTNIHPNSRPDPSSRPDPNSRPDANSRSHSGSVLPSNISKSSQRGKGFSCLLEDQSFWNIQTACLEIGFEELCLESHLPKFSKQQLIGPPPMDSSTVSCRIIHQIPLSSECCSGKNRSYTSVP